MFAFRGLFMRRTSRPASTAKPPVQRKTSTMPPTATQRISTEALSHVLAVTTMPRHARLRTAPGSAEADVPSTTASIAMPPIYPVKSERITSPVANASATARIIGRRLIAPRLAPQRCGSVRARHGAGRKAETGNGDDRRQYQQPA